MWRKEKKEREGATIWTASRLELEKGEEIINRETKRRYLEECNRTQRVSDPFSGNFGRWVYNYPYLSKGGTLTEVTIFISPRRSSPSILYLVHTYFHDTGAISSSFTQIHNLLYSTNIIGWFY